MGLPIKIFSSGGSGGGGASASNSFSIMQPITGTSPVASSATDTLTFASADGSVSIVGNSGTDTLDFSASSLTFKTIACPTGTNPVADSSADTLTLATDNLLLTITGDSAADSVTFRVEPGADTSYALLAGRAGGQSLIGGTASGENLTLQSTAHATRGKIIIVDSLTVGASQTMSNTNSFSLGQGSNVSGQMSGSLGTGNVVSGSFGAVAIGNSNTASGQTAIAIGLSAQSAAISSIAMGTRAYAPVGANGSIVMADANPGGVSTTDTASVLDGRLSRFNGGYKWRKTTAAGPQVEWQQATVATTDATQTTLLTWAVAASTTHKVTAHVVGRRTGGTGGAAGDSAVYELKAMVKNVAGTVTVSAITNVITVEDQAGWDATIDVSSTNIRVRITGAADNNVTWTCRLEADQC